MLYAKVTRPPELKHRQSSSIVFWRPMKWFPSTPLVLALCIGKFLWSTRPIVWKTPLQSFSDFSQTIGNKPCFKLTIFFKNCEYLSSINKFWPLQFNEFFLSQTIASTTKCSWPVHRCKTIWKSCFIYSTSWRLPSSTVWRHFKANLQTLPRKNKSEHCTIF